MSSMAIPLATRLPTKGGGNSGLSAATPGARAGRSSPRAPGLLGGLPAQLALAGAEVPTTEVGPEPGVVLAGLAISTSRSIVRRPSKASLP